MSSFAVNSIDRYMQTPKLSNSDYSPVLQLCTDMNRTYSLKRKDALQIQFPSAEPIDSNDITKYLKNSRAQFGLT